MQTGDVLTNLLIMGLCYAYILLTILVSSRIGRLLHVSQRVSRKFLHIMIGNLPFIIPFFTSDIYPVLVAAPFVLVTFLASPYSPSENVRKQLKGLADITEEGHHLGLVLYAVSYTVLALLFASKSYVIAAGILPMAYGDSAASIVGERYGRRKYKLVAAKSLEGSAAMFTASFTSLAAGLIFFSTLYHFSFYGAILPALGATLAATLAEALSPMGFDNITVPALSASIFVLLSGGL